MVEVTASPAGQDAMSHRSGRQDGVPGTSCHAQAASSSVLAVTLPDSDVISSGKLEIREGRRPEGGRKGWFHLHSAAGGVWGAGFNGILAAAPHRLIKCQHFTHTFMSSRIWLQINI